MGHGAICGIPYSKIRDMAYPAPGDELILAQIHDSLEDFFGLGQDYVFQDWLVGDKSVHAGDALDRASRSSKSSSAMRAAISAP